MSSNPDRHQRHRTNEPRSILGRQVHSCRELSCYAATWGPFCVTHAALIDRDGTP